ncbi:MAG TPA: branched-chain amino acid ABC transporter ATP-binding protein/permease, partial [Gammaproteobacteria bacterium]|nr:branched-chain amino acid ABC transporter ATP-binding protein/permease [Gammaproteobacteria bacterium]
DRFGLTPWLGIPLAGVLGGLAGLAVGFPTFRLRGHYFALAMLAYPLALLYVFQWLGLQELALPMKRDAPRAFMQFADQRVYVWLASGLLLGAMVVTRLVERSRFGRSLLAIKQDETAAEAAGVDTLRVKLEAITLSGAMAGVIGGFYAVVLLVVTPEAVFGLLVSAQALIVAMFGGVGTVWGPVIGAVTLVPLSDWLYAALGNRVPGIQGIIYGLAIIAVIRLAPEGVFWRLRDLLHRRALGREVSGKPAAVAATAAAAEVSNADARPTVTAAERVPSSAAATNEGPVREGPVLEGPVLEIHGLSKSFGGLRAIDSVSLTVGRAEILGIIGPNGAGKTTLFNLLNGFIEPDSGKILFEGRDITGARPNRICRAGVGRTFQVVKPFPRMSLAENVVIGAYAHTSTHAAASDAANQAIAAVGLQDAAAVVAGNATNMQLRLMELARALASRPRLLLLDEILAGLATGEVQELVERILTLPALGVTVVIIEHTMQAMVRLVDRFVVLDHGSVLTEGTPERVTRDPRVIEAYLGKKWLADA